MTVKYIHNSQGQQESVIIPINLWRLIQSYLPLALNKPTKAKKNVSDFQPTEYFGMISYLNLDIEEELKIMRDEWNRNF